MDLRKSSITADILNFISDGKLHTYQEIADEVEVSYSTARRHIQSLSYRYPIEIFCGGERKGGVYLDKRFMEQGKMRSNDELQLIRQGLELLQKSGLDVDQKKLAELIKEYTLPTKLQEKGEANENGNVN
jgi:predicted DNA-binding transcriptional regulator YafY